ncbi:unnamed protein product, partial [Menidia menidia]
SVDALKAHLSRCHSYAERLDIEKDAHTYYSCHLCNFKHPFSETVLFGHLKSHLRKHEMVACPFRNCNYHTNVYSSSNAHKSRAHSGNSDYEDVMVSVENDDTPATSFADGVDEGPTQGEATGDFNQTENESDIIRKTIQEVLLIQETVVSETCLDELVSSVMSCTIFTSATAKGEKLTTTKRRKTYVERNYPVVRPVQYELEPGHTTVHISILEMIQEMFRHTDILDKIKETKPAQQGQYMSHQDGSYFKDNELVSSKELTLPLLLVSDNLAAHCFAGFMKSFRAKYFCRFCTDTLAQIQSYEVADKEFSLALPMFSRTEQIFLVNNHIVFLCREHESRYIEHLCSHEL